MGVFDPDRLENISPDEFRRSVQRLMLGYGYEVFSVDGPNDHGGDLFCEKEGEVFVLQTKWKKRGQDKPISHGIVDELFKARNYYNAHAAIAVTNSKFSAKALKELKKHTDRGIKLDFWDIDTLQHLLLDAPPKKDFLLHKYQNKAKTKILEDLSERKRALLYFATGLGKTFVAGSVIQEFINARGAKHILVLAHMTDLIEQLQRSLWEFLDFSTDSQLIDSSNKPSDLNGLTVSTNLSILPILMTDYRPDLVIFDECHHLGSDNTYGEVLKCLEDIPILGLTATPWRGDGYDIESLSMKE